jgi:hypothetical protein
MTKSRVDDGRAKVKYVLKNARAGQAVGALRMHRRVATLPLGYNRWSSASDEFSKLSQKPGLYINGPPLNQPHQ